MNVSITFPVEMETPLRRRAEAAGKDVATIVKEFVSDRLAEEASPPATATSHAEFMAKLQRVIDLHPRSNGSIDDGRESIYAGRGE